MTTYNKWDDGVISTLAQEWYPLWGHHNGHPSLDDSTNLKSAWTLPESRLLTTQLFDTLDAFSNHHATEDPHTFATFLHCQKRLLTHINTLYASYEALVEDSLLSGRPPLLLRQI
ncbi:hypothetical protein FRB94_013672 [Tulasnella sp. JGI-2019a]|nr:hypothetical protein FRB94_013672 [Tulasnella sp. JGI-2019a]